MKTLRQNVGIDIAKDSFVATITLLLESQDIKHLRTKKFANSDRGFASFFEWVNSLANNSISISYTMEATGVYYEGLAFFLWEKQSVIHVLLPNKVKNFAKSLNVKSKTDKIDSQILGQMGAERILDKWELGAKIYRHLRTLTRERQLLIKERTRCKNQLHAMNHSAEPIQATVSRCNDHISYLDEQIQTVEKEIMELINTDSFIKDKAKKIITIPGISFMTFAVVIAETFGFVNIKNMRQLSSYAGYDIIQRESGNWKGKTQISKKGNSKIRQALYMPAISCKTHAETYNKFYLRLNKTKQNGMITGTAIQRKVLGLMYVLWKNDQNYIDNYEMIKAS